MLTRIRVVLLLVAVMATSVTACLWDYDTLEMERQRFPSALELITGKFLRHSQELYQWRIGDRTRRIEQSPKPVLFDDLASAYDKVGDHAQAIEIMLGKAKQYPGLYETHANLGTFYVHSGQLEKGLVELEKAIAINPDAHFGRERFQIHLVKYILSRSDQFPPPLPLKNEEAAERDDFAAFVLNAEGGLTSGKEQAVIKDAVKGVLGMMRFGHYDSPILLEALGDLLRHGELENSANLAARCYLKASFEVSSEESKEAYRKYAAHSLRWQTPGKGESRQIKLNEVEWQLKKEIKEADAWFAQIANDERNWIKQRVDVDHAFSEKYYQEPKPLGASVPTVSGGRLWFVYALISVCVGSLLLAFRIHRGRITVQG